ncbi:MAG: MFS transporter [Thermaerobacter sp.]|nr:MFS transporter [Thermaerobacter sp.]
MATARAVERRNFTGLAWHGTFLAAATALGQPTTILPAYVALLGGSPLLVGTMLSVLLAGSVLPELFFAHIVEGSPRKRPYLLWAVYSRAVAWLMLGTLTWLFARSAPLLLLLLLFALLAVFAVGGSLCSVAYTDIYGRSIAPGVRGRFYASRQFLGSIAALAVTYLAGILLSRNHGGSPATYALLFLGTGLLMLLAGTGFLLVRETPVEATAKPSLSAYLRQVPVLWSRDPGLRALVWIENVASLHLMLLPFYMLLAAAWLHSPASAVAFYTMAQIVGGALSNVVWGWLNDRFGSGAVLRTCLLLGAGMPLLALVLAAFWPSGYFLIFVVLGAAIASRNLAYNNVLVDIAPVPLRATYTGLVGTLTAPTLLLPMLGGSLIGLFGFRDVFLLVALALGLAAFTVGRSPYLSVAPKV